MDNFATKRVKERLIRLATIRRGTPDAYETDSLFGTRIASLSSFRMRVDFRWGGFADVVWASFHFTHGSGSMFGHPWCMSKPDARQLWADMVKAGWECPDGDLDHGR
jgi:hypothetical protein